MEPWVVSLFGSLGSILSVLQYISPVPTFYRIVKNKTTEEFESLPYICTVLNSCLWTYYGIIKPDSFVCIVNGFGAALEAIYVLLLIKYSPPKKKAKTAVMAIILNVGVFCGAVLATYFGVDDRFRAQVVGFLCLTPMVAMYASPLAVLGYCDYNKKCGIHALQFINCSISYGGVWTIYAILVRDYFLGVPNGIGFLFGVIQLILYCIYKDYKGSQTSLQESIEEGTKHEPLLLGH